MRDEVMGGVDHFSKHRGGYKTHSGWFTNTKMVTVQCAGF